MLIPTIPSCTSNMVSPDRRSESESESMTQVRDASTRGSCIALPAQVQFFVSCIMVRNDQD